MIAFIDDQRVIHGVEPICKVLPIAPSTYHERVAQRCDSLRLSARARRDLALRVEVRRVTEKSIKKAHLFLQPFDSTSSFRPAPMNLARV